MIFGQIADDSKTSGLALTLFHKKLTDVISDYKSITDDKIGFKKIGAALNGVSGKNDFLSDGDVQKIRQYNALLSQGKSVSEASSIALKDASDNAKRLATSANGAAVSEKLLSNETQTLTVKQKAATVATKLLASALNALTTIGISFAISAAIKAIDKFVHREEESMEKAQEVMQSTLEVVESGKREMEQVDDLMSSYIKLASTTSDLTSENEQLVEIQNQLNDSLDTQKGKVDLLNNSLLENIELLRQQKLQEAEKVVTETQASYDSAKRGTNASYEAITILDAKNRKEISKAVEEIQSATGMRISGTLSEQSKQIEEMLNQYRKINDYSTEYYDSVVSAKQAIDKQVESWNTIISTYEKAQRAVSGLTISEDVKKNFDDTLQKTIELGQKLNSDMNPVQKYGVVQQLSDLKSQLFEIAGTNTELQGIINTTFSAFETGSDGAIGSLENLREAFYESLDEMQKGAFTNIDKMKSALQTLAGGDALSSGDFWGLMELDTDKIISDISMVGDKFVVNEEQLIQLKDTYIQKQAQAIQEQINGANSERDKLKEQLKIEKLILETQIAQGINSSGDERILREQKAKIQEIERAMAEYGEQISLDTILLEQLNANLGNTVDKQKQLTDEIKRLNDYADNLLKAQEYRIDQIVDGHEAEKEALEAEKDLLEEQLDSLKEQASALEELIKNYENVNSIVQKTIESEVKALEAEKQAIEDSYNERINALKTENDERKDALEYAQKLANLENAKNNKVRVIDETRGFRYESVKEDVVNAENDLADFENEQAIKALERERDEATKALDAQIKVEQQYADQWQEVLDEIQTEEDERLAAEILGADWREKIANHDIEIMEKFKNEYRNHNSNLKTLTNTEIKLKQAAIDAKNAEIKAKQEQIDMWKKYKTAVQNAASDIKAANDGYMSMINTVEINEKSSLENRQTNLENFKNAYANAIGTAIDLQQQLDSMSGDYSYSFNVDNLDALERAAEASKKIAASAATTYTIADRVVQMQANKSIDEVSSDIGRSVAEIMSSLFGFSSGGVADYTGLAMLHGTKRAPETIFNAKDSAKLYEMVHSTPNLMADMIAKATKISGFSLANGSSNTSNSAVNIGSINVYANNPSELTQGLDKQLDKYFRNKLTQGYTGK